MCRRMRRTSSSASSTSPTWSASRWSGSANEPRGITCKTVSKAAVVIWIVAAVEGTVAGRSLAERGRIASPLQLQMGYYPTKNVPYSQWAGV